MSEWLGTGLQNRSHQFESGWNLQRESLKSDSFFIYIVLGNSATTQLQLDFVISLF